jgi:hypothetical protein
MAEKASPAANTAPMLTKSRGCDVDFIEFSPIGFTLSHLRDRKFIWFSAVNGRVIFIYTKHVFYT